MAHKVFCVKLQREAEGLDEPPFDSELGQKIYKNVSREAWDQWQEHMKMLLNEYRLQPCRYNLDGCCGARCSCLHRVFLVSGSGSAW